MSFVELDRRHAWNRAALGEARRGAYPGCVGVVPDAGPLVQGVDGTRYPRAVRSWWFYGIRPGAPRVGRHGIA